LVRKGEVNFAVADHNLFDDGFDDLALVVGWKRGPAIIEGIGFMEGTSSTESLLIFKKSTSPTS